MPMSVDLVPDYVNVRTPSQPVVQIARQTMIDPRIPAVVPGERLNEAVVDYLRTGLAAGMECPDPADPSLERFRVVA